MFRMPSTLGYMAFFVVVGLGIPAGVVWFLFRSGQPLPAGGRAVQTIGRGIQPDHFALVLAVGVIDVIAIVASLRLLAGVAAGGSAAVVAGGFAILLVILLGYTWRAATLASVRRRSQ